MTIDNLKQHIEKTLSTTRKSFKLGELRILAVPFLLLLTPAGARPTSVLRLRFGDIRVVLARYLVVDEHIDGARHVFCVCFSSRLSRKRELSSLRLCSMSCLLRLDTGHLTRCDTDEFWTIRSRRRGKSVSHSLSVSMTKYAASR